MQQTYRTKTQVTKGGKLSIKGLPFQAGETVEVTVRRGKEIPAYCKISSTRETSHLSPAL